jgi:hypothetical protein
LIDILAVVKVNLLLLIGRIDDLKCLEEINYKLFLKERKNNERSLEVVNLRVKIETLGKL